MNLFRPDNFSESDIHYEQASLDNILFRSIIDKYYSDHKIINIKKVGSTAINSENYKITVTVDDDEKKVLLRKYHTLKLEQIVFYLDILEQLKNLGVQVSGIINTLENKSVLEFAGHNYTLFDFVEGEYFSPSEDSFRSVARGVAKMHNAFDKLPDDYFEKVSVLSQESYTYFNEVTDYTKDDFLEIEKIITAKDELTAEDKSVVEKIPLFIKTVEQIKNKQSKIDNLEKSLIHSDLHPHNLLIKTNQLQALLDFDGLRVSEQARDVGFVIYRLGRQFFVNRSTTLNDKDGINLTELFLAEYETVRPLTKEEKILMPILVKDEFMRKILFVLNGVYKENNHTWGKDLPKFLVAIDEINYFWN